MCGLAGYATQAGVQLSTPERAERRRIFQALLWAMEERGGDSTGLAAIDTGTGRFRLLRRVEGASRVLGGKAYAAFLEATRDANVLIGHTRLATMGKVCKRNAHPFHVGRVVGAHNGIVQNWKDVAPQVDVDSQAVFHALDEEQDPLVALKRLRGSFALSWYDDRDGLVRLARGDNPLAFAYSPSLRTYFWCSLDSYLTVALMAAPIGVQWLDLKDNSLVALDPQAGTHAGAVPVEWAPAPPLGQGAQEGEWQLRRALDELANYSGVLPTLAPLGPDDPRVAPCVGCRKKVPYEADVKEFVCPDCLDETLGELAFLAEAGQGWDDPYHEDWRDEEAVTERAPRKRDPEEATVVASA